MKKLNNKFDTKEFLGKLISGGEEPEHNQRPEKRSHIPFRLNFLFFIIFALFVALIARLGFVQIIDAERIATQVDNSTTVEIKESTPRGMIYDAKGKVLAANVANAAITYTRGNNISSGDILKVAQKLGKLIDVPVDDKLSVRDKKDYYLADEDRYAKVEGTLSDKEKMDKNGDYLSDSDLYQVVVDKLSDDEVNALSADELKIATIFTRMNTASALNTVFVKNEGVTNEEMAIVAENGKELSGVSTGTDWTRQYTDESTIRELLGTISTEQTGLPAEKAKEYLKKGYAMNDRVGTSNLELQYEDALQGKKAVSEVKLNSSGGIASQTEKEAGAKGDNLMLTIDTDFQKQVQAIVEQTFNGIASGSGIYSPGAYVVVMKPSTGAVLAMSGVSHDIGSSTTTADISGTYLKNFEPGSTVKPATVTSGYENGVLSGNDTLVDQPIIIGASSEFNQAKSSWFNTSGTIPITAERALEQSSNSYMMQVAIKLLGLEYTPNMENFPLTNNQTSAYEKLRKTYGEYGLGVSTGIDLPNEQTGLHPDDWDKIDAGKILDLSFGQFDTYSAMQLAQYASTIANSGKRVSAHIVEGIYGNDANGNLDKNNEVKKAGGSTLNQINISADQWDVIQTGMYQVVYGGYGTGRALSSAPVTVHAKTGTAETFYTKEDGSQVSVDNSNLICYTDTGDINNDIAISVVLPQLTSDSGTNTNLALQIINAYYAAQTAAENTNSADTNQ